MRRLFTILAFVALAQCQKKKLTVVADTSSVDILVQTAVKSVADFSLTVESLQENLNITLNSTQVLQSNTLAIPQEAKANQIATIDDVMLTAKDIERLTGTVSTNCTQEATTATNVLRTESVNNILACVKPLTDLDDIISNLVDIKDVLQKFQKNTTSASLQSCVPKTNAAFNFFETLKIKTCLTNAVASYRNYVNEKSTSVSATLENVKNLSENGITIIKDCLKKESAKTKSSADVITNALIKCADIIPAFLANVTRTINNVNQTVTVNVEKNLTRISTLTKDSLDGITNLEKTSKEKLVAFKEHITDAVANLKPYYQTKFLDEEALKENIFSIIEKQISESSKSLNSNQALLYSNASELIKKLSEITASASSDKLQECLKPENKSSIAIVDCLTEKSALYSAGVYQLANVSVGLNAKYDDIQKEVVRTTKYAIKKIEKLAITSKDTAEFLYDKSGIDLLTLVKDQLDLLLLPEKNTILSQINKKFEQLVDEYYKIDAFIDKVRSKVAQNVASTGQPIREAIELLAIIDPNRNYEILYNKSLAIASGAETKIHNVINDVLVKQSENLFKTVGVLNDNYSNRLKTDNTSGYACIYKEDAFFTCVALCLKNISKNATDFFQKTLNELDRLLAAAKDLPNSAESSIDLATKQIKESATNESVKQAGSAFRDSNMTKEEYFAFVNREIGNFNRTLLPQLLEVGDGIIDNAAKVYDKQFVALQTVRPKINEVIDKVNTAVSDILLLYPSAPINNKTIVALANAAFERVYKTFNVVTLPANNLTDVGNSLKKQAREIFASVYDQPLRSKCYDIYPVLEDAITCLSKALNNMTEELNKLTETLYAVSSNALTIKNDARETLKENSTAELQKLDADSTEIANSYYLHYSVNNEALYAKVYQTIQRAITQHQRTILFNINFLNVLVVQMPEREEKARYEINKNLTGSTGFLLNAVNAIRYQGNPKLLGNQLELHTNLTENYTRIIDPYIPKYKGDITYHQELYNNYTAENNALLKYGSPENLNATCNRTLPVYVYSKCIRKIGDTFVQNMQRQLNVTTLAQNNASNILSKTEGTLRDLMNGIVANLSKYNIEASKSIAEDLYTFGGFTVESIYRLGNSINNRSYMTMFPTIQKLASDNSKIVDSIKSLNFNAIFPIESRLERYVNSITSAFKRAIAMSDGLTMDNEGAKAQQLADEYARKFKNFTDSLVVKAVDLGNVTGRELALATSLEETFTLKYLYDFCQVGGPFPISDANVCSNGVTWTNFVNTRNKLNLITGYNNDLVTLNNTIVSQVQNYGNKLEEEFAAYSQPVIDKLYTWAGL